MNFTHKKLWLTAGALLIGTMLIVAWRVVDPVQLSYARYMAQKTEEALYLLENDPVLYFRETQDAARLVAAATADGILSSPQTHYILALQYEREGNTEEAEALLREVILDVDTWSWPYVSLGILLARSGEDYLEEAESLLNKAVELEPDWVRPYNSLSVVLRLLGRFEEAEIMSLHALELDPYDVAAHNNFANLLVLEERYEEAESHYRFAMESEPYNAKPPYNLACLFSVIGSFQEACDYLEMAVALNESARSDAAMDPYFDPMRSYPPFEEIIYGEVLTSRSENDWDEEEEADADIDADPPMEAQEEALSPDVKEESDSDEEHAAEEPGHTEAAEADTAAEDTQPSEEAQENESP
ncbi:MAG: hypothetical protein WCX86_04705 [Candidatus Hydrogenedentales bacterium]